MSGLLLGVDIGTSSSKGVLAHPDGEIIATSERPHELSLLRPRWAEHDAEHIWWADFKAICADLLPRVDGALAAVCVSGIGPCLLAANEAGQPLRPAILYGIDTRATREIEEINELYGVQTILDRWGSPLASQAVGPKLLWLRRNEPEVWKRIRRFLMASSFIVYRLTGEYVLEHHSAGQCELRHNLEVMREADGRGKRLVTVGGRTKGGLWTQIVSDVTERTQELPEETIGASYGDVLLAAIAVDLANRYLLYNVNVTDKRRHCNAALFS
jgi:xylulokinase